MLGCWIRQVISTIIRSKPMLAQNMFTKDVIKMLTKLDHHTILTLKAQTYQISQFCCSKCKNQIGMVVPCRGGQTRLCLKCGKSQKSQGTSKRNGNMYGGT